MRSTDDVMTWNSLIRALVQPAAVIAREKLRKDGNVA
jgi:hypothetical protein